MKYISKIPDTDINLNKDSNWNNTGCYAVTKLDG